MLEIKDISIRFGDFSLEEVSLSIAPGDYLALLGVSGAGKTVLLEVLAGLVKPDKGEIRWNDRDITQTRIQQRPVGLVYQDLSLFPHLNVFANIAYALKVRKVPAAEQRKRVLSLARETGVDHLLDRFPGTLSGGEAQRVALARTLAADPDILLLDEPLANLDVKLKTGLRKLLRQINRSGKTIIHVTHDFMEAATLANQVAVIENGRLAQVGTPEEVFRHPRSEFVARFSGIKNIFSCSVELSAGPENSLQAILPGGQHISFLGNETGKEGFVMIPQEDIVLSENPLESSALNQLKGVVREAYLSGNGMEILIDAGLELVASLSRHSFEKMNIVQGKTVWASFKASAVKFLAG
ncbi:MAG: ABC transporter ATP-binding protein [Bacteroides sp.]|jgi:molybdate transport system ATP-binding protein/molybdate/tungstate transport system ATP-binding protein|nr:ABC transporter ATP-binding protein [Bacteroides sp.]